MQIIYPWPPICHVYIYSTHCHRIRVEQQGGIGWNWSPAMNFGRNQCHRGMRWMAVGMREGEREGEGRTKPGRSQDEAVLPPAMWHIFRLPEHREQRAQSMNPAIKIINCYVLECSYKSHKPRPISRRTQTIMFDFHNW